MSSTRKGADRLGQYAGSGRDRCAISWQQALAVLLVEGIITANEATFVQLGKFTPVSILGLISILSIFLLFNYAFG